MAEIKRTEIAQLGEFGLIDHLTKDLKPQNSSTLYGVGDDCAVLDYSDKDKEVLVTTDMLMEGVHFDLTYVPLKHLGYKSAMVNISDIYAMNGTPRQMTVSVALSKRFSVEDMEDFYAGVVLACQRHGVDLVGGDTTSSLTGLAISITCIGEAEKGKAVYRNGAGPLVDHRDSIFAADLISDPDKVLCGFRDLVVDLFTNGIQIRIDTVKETDTHRDRPDIEILLGDHVDGLEGLVQLYHGIRSCASCRKSLHAVP